MEIIKVQDVAWVPKSVASLFTLENLAITTKKVKSDRCFEIFCLEDGEVLTEIDFDGVINHQFKESFASIEYTKLIKNYVYVLVGLVTSSCEDSPKKKFNHAFQIAFSVDTDNPADNVTKEELLKALKNKVDEIEATGEILEAVGAPYDSYENF